MKLACGAWLIALLTAFAVPASAADQHWIKIQSPHFVVITDATDKRGREVAFHFEQMRSVYGALMTRQKVNLPVPMQIVAFRDTRELRQFAPLWRGKPTEVAGLWVPGDDQCFIMLDLSTENPWQIVFHEYAHQLMNGNLSANTDPWFEEGFAEYFSTIEVDNRQARVGKVPDQEYVLLRQVGMMKIADLFRVQHNSAAYNETGDHRNVFYAESGMLVHYIFDNDLLARLADYFTLAHDKGLPVEEAIQQAFAMTASDFDEKLRAYVLSGRYRYYAIPTPATLNAGSYLVSNLSSADSNAVLANLHLHSIDYRDKAFAEFEDVLKSDPNNESALSGLGYGYLMRRDFPKAADYFFKAAAADPNDPYVLYYSALLVQQDQGIGLGTDRDRLNHIQQQLEKATSLAPEFADAYALLAFTYSSQGKNELGLKTMLKAVELDPHNEAYWLNLANLMMVNRRFDEAAKVLEQLEKSSDREIAARASRYHLEIPEAKAEAEAEAVNSRTVNEVKGKAGASGSAESMASREPNASAVRWIKGTLLSVECSSSLQAVATIQTSDATWKLHTGDSTRLIVIGADQLSCDWKNQPVAVNFHETGIGTGELVSVELQ